jgi:hypothetical protein
VNQTQNQHCHALSNYKFHNNTKPGKSKWEIAKLNVHAYKVHDETAKVNQFERTTTAISVYVNRTLKVGTT